MVKRARSSIVSDFKSRIDETQGVRGAGKIYQENARLKEELDVLRSRLEQEQGKKKVHIAKIQPSDQSRRTFTAKDIQNRVLSLLAEGQLSSLILIPRDDGSYQLEDGELTWRAANSLVTQGYKEWEYLEAVESNFVPQQGNDVFRRSLLHHQHAVHLNELDRAEAVFRESRKILYPELTTSNLQLPSPDGSQEKCVKKIINKLANLYNRNQEFADLFDTIEILGGEEFWVRLDEIKDFTTAEKEIIWLFRSLQIPIVSFKANALKTIFYSSELKTAIREGDILCSHAAVIDSVKDPQQQLEILSQCIARRWTLSQLKAEVKKLKPSEFENKTLKQVFVTLGKLDPKLTATLKQEERQQLIAKLESILSILNQSN